MGGIFFTILIYFLGLFCVMACCVRYVHMLQLESYQNKMYLKWVKNHYRENRDLLITVASIGVFLLCTLGYYLLDNTGLMTSITVIALVGIAGYSGYVYFSAGKKKPLVYTPRVRRILMMTFFLVAFLFYLLSHFTMYATLLFLLFLPLAPYLVLLANLCLYPMERYIKNGFFKQAKEILKNRPDLIKIGITGSFGKTSAKFILTTILSEKYDILCSPASYNTPMGLTKVIREMLEDHHQVFVAEMGARYVGDIQELCDLVHPKYGLITSIGKQHLETFGSFANIVSTKYSLIENLPASGIGYLPNDGAACLEKYQVRDKKKRLYSVEPGKDAFVWAENIQMDQSGSVFDLVCDAGRVTLNTCLLGKHNIQNILGCCAVALDLGLTLAQIQSGVAKVQPIEHRLQLMPSPNGVVIIDDAFNANPTGTKMALDVLTYFEGKKIIVTPGLVELGDEEEALNREFGQGIAKVCDIAVLVGKRFAPYLKEGLLNSGFDQGSIVELESLEEVTRFIGVYAKPGDVVLFENDLPDNYR